MSGLLNYLTTIFYCLLILLIIVFVCTYIYFKNAYQYWAKLGVEYVKPSFFFGSIRQCFDGTTHANDVLKWIHNEIKGPFAGVYFFSKPVLFVKDPELLKHILVKDFNNFADRGVHSDGENDPLSLHLFRLSGPRWRSLRTKLTPVFTSGKLKVMFPFIIKNGEQLQSSLEEFAVNRQIADIEDICSRYTIDVISSTAFGIETNSFLDPNNEMCVFIKEISKQDRSYGNGIKQNLALTCPELLKMFKQSTHSSAINNFVYNIVKRIIDYRFINNFIRNDFLQLLIQLRSDGQEVKNDLSQFYDDKKNASNNLTFDELVAQAYVFIVAGFETSASTMSNCLFELAKHPDIQKRTQKHVNDILKKHGGKFTYEAIVEMEYLSMIVSETLRKYAPLGFLNRIAKDDFKIPNTDIVILKNMNVIISVAGLHYDSQYYPNPNKFDPERFSPENKENIIPYTYLPFGEGPRHCIGMRLGKMQTVSGLAMILSKYNFEICPETPKEIEFVCGQIINLNKKKVKLFISKRNE